MSLFGGKPSIIPVFRGAATRMKRAEQSSMAFGKEKNEPVGKHAQANNQNGAPAQGFVPATYGQVEPETLPDPEKKKKRKKIALIVTGSILGVLLLAYGIGAFFFTDHFFPNTTLNDKDLSFESSSTLSEDLTKQVSEYTLDVEGQGFTMSFAKGEAALKIDTDQVARDATASQNVWAWPYEAFMEHDISDVIVASFDDSALAETVKAKVTEFNATAKPCADAYITYDKESDAFTVQPEVYGTQLDSDKVLKKIEESMSAMRTKCSIEKEDLILPKLYGVDPRMMQAAQQAGTMFPGEIKLVLNSSVTAGVIDKELFASWIKVNVETITPEIDRTKVDEWTAEKAEGMNTVGTTRTWTRADGKVCTASNGTYGWKVDTESLSQTVFDAVSAGNTTTIDIPCEQSAAAFNGAGKRDWAAYVDIDLSEQTVRYYDASDNLVYSAPCITGTPTADRATPQGVYYLNHKQSPSTLIGYKPNGEKDYETKVQYWMPFKGNSVGLHDATWQSGFGGTRYRDGYGSHGCVNLSSEAAAWFYENLTVGTPVITHE